MGSTAERFARLATGFYATVHALGAWVVEPAWGLDLLVKEDGIVDGDLPLRVKWDHRGETPVPGDRMSVSASGVATHASRTIRDGEGDGGPVWGLSLAANTMPSFAERMRASLASGDAAARRVARRELAKLAERNASRRAKGWRPLGEEVSRV